MRTLKKLASIFGTIVGSAFIAAALIGFFWYYPVFMAGEESGFSGAIAAIMTLLAWIFLGSAMIFPTLIAVSVLFLIAFGISKLCANQPRWVAFAAASLVVTVIALILPVVATVYSF